MEGFNLEGALQDYKIFLRDDLSEKNCRGISNVCVLKCTCLSFLGLDENDSLAGSVSHYMVGWEAFPGKEKDRILGGIEICAATLKSEGDVVPQERRTIVNLQRGKRSSPRTNKQSKPQQGRTRRNPREGIYVNCKSQRRSKLAPSGINPEVPAGQFQRRSELAPKGINPEAPAKAKRNPREGISGDFHSQGRSELAPKGNKFRGASRKFFT